MYVSICALNRIYVWGSYTFRCAPLKSNNRTTVELRSKVINNGCHSKILRSWGRSYRCVQTWNHAVIRAIPPASPAQTRSMEFAMLTASLQNIIPSAVVLSRLYIHIPPCTQMGVGDVNWEDPFMLTTASERLTSKHEKKLRSKTFVRLDCGGLKHSK